MDRQRVVSSYIHSVGYNEDKWTLEIEFNTGSIYRYYDVPYSDYEGLINAESPGRYFHDYIKNGEYDFMRVRDDDRCPFCGESLSDDYERFTCQNCGNLIYSFYESSKQTHPVPDEDNQRFPDEEPLAKTSVSTTGNLEKHGESDKISDTEKNTKAVASSPKQTSSVSQGEINVGHHDTCIGCGCLVAIIVVILLMLYAC